MKHFSEIITKNNVDLNEEYNKLFELFYLVKPFQGESDYSLYEYLEKNFLAFPYRSTSVTLADFNKTHGFAFERQPEDFNIDYLIAFCEYSYNLAIYLQAGPSYDPMYLVNHSKYISLYLEQVKEVINVLRYKVVYNEGLYEFVPEDVVVESIIEEVDKTLAERLYEYNHHSLKGNIGKKKATLFAIYSKMSAEEKILEKVNKKLSDNLAFAFNNLDIRHNNKDEGSKSFKDETASMKDKELEEWYDNLYKLCLQAILEVKNSEIIKKLEDLKKEYKK